MTARHVALSAAVGSVSGAVGMLVLLFAFTAGNQLIRGHRARRQTPAPSPAGLTVVGGAS